MSDSGVPRRLLQATAVTALAAVTLAGCTGAGGLAGGGGSSSAAPGSAAERALPSDGQAFDAVGGARRGGAEAQQAVDLLARDVIQRASMTVRTRDVGGALVQVRTIVDGAQGVVADEHTVTSRRGDARRSSLTLRVPAETFDAVLRDLGDLGRLASQRVSTEDVSTEVVDVEARIISAERTLQRIRELLEQADDFSDVLSLEAELARREADLASLKAQQAYLEDQTTLSTIDLTLRPPLPDRVDEDEEQPAGFVSGLDVGWDALVALVTVVLTALGVVVPLLLVLVPVGLLLWWALRRFARRQPASPPASPPAA